MITAMKLWAIRRFPPDAAETRPERIQRGDGNPRFLRISKEAPFPVEPFAESLVPTDFTEVVTFRVYRKKVPLEWLAFVHVRANCWGGVTSYTDYSSLNWDGRSLPEPAVGG